MRCLRLLLFFPLAIALLVGSVPAHAQFGKLLKRFGTSAAKEGTQATTRRLLSTRRDLQDVNVLLRVATHLRPDQAPQVEQFLKHASSGGSLTDEQWTWLDSLAEELEAPLEQAADKIQSGARVPLIGSRVLQEGKAMLLGSPEHMAQCWLEYQLRHPDKFPTFSYAPDPTWQRLYRSILDNQPAGNKFEQELFKLKGYSKNTALMMPPPGSSEQGFIADALPDAPAELVWGRPYRFFEAKARKELALTGNIKAMIEYVGKYGGHLELWIRSDKHPEGATHLTGPLRDELRKLEQRGRATLRAYP